MAQKPQIAYDLQRLTQANVSWLIGQKPSWLRENGDLFRRNPDGSYDGRDVFSTMAQILGSPIVQKSPAEAVLDDLRDTSKCGFCTSGRRDECPAHGPGGFMV